MAIPERVKNKMKELGLKGVNQPKRTPNHPTKSWVVMASQNGRYKLVRFGEQGADPVKSPKSENERKRQKSFKDRFRKLYESKGKGNKLSAIYWAWRLW